MRDAASDSGDPWTRRGERGPRRVFIGWHEPLVCLAAKYLSEYAADYAAESAQPPNRPENLSSNLIDLRHCLCVTGSSRGALRLMENLVRYAENNHRGLLAPKIMTIGSLSTLLAPPRLQCPDSLTAALLWTAALRDCP